MHNIIGKESNTCELFLVYVGDGKYEYEITSNNGMLISGEMESHELHNNSFSVGKSVFPYYGLSYKDNDELVRFAVNHIYARHMQEIVDAYLPDDIKPKRKYLITKGPIESLDTIVVGGVPIEVPEIEFSAKSGRVIVDGVGQQRDRLEFEIDNDGMSYVNIEVSQ